MVRAPPCHGGGHEFESRPGRFLHFGSLAQLGEHLPYKQRVIGSNPITSTYRNLYIDCCKFRCNLIALSWRLKVHIMRILRFKFSPWGEDAGMAELADAQDLKSCGSKISYRFDSGCRQCLNRDINLISVCSSAG